MGLAFSGADGKLSGYGDGFSEALGFESGLPMGFGGGDDFAYGDVFLSGSALTIDQIF